jgi:hypothetical protein
LVRNSGWTRPNNSWKIVPHLFDQHAGMDEGLDDDTDF